MKTDIDRLHAVLDDPCPGPRTGKTTALCHLIAGAIEMGQERIDVVLTQERDRRHFLLHLQQVLWEHDIGGHYDCNLGTLDTWLPRCHVATHTTVRTLRGLRGGVWDGRWDATPRLIDIEDLYQEGWGRERWEGTR